MDKKEKTTAPVSSAPTDAELSSVQSTTESITEKHTEIKEKQAVSDAPLNEKVSSTLCWNLVLHKISK